MKVHIGNYPKRPEKKARTIKVQIDRWDAFSADHTLALIIHPLIKKLKECDNGFPASITDEEWHTILDKIIWSMGQIVEEDPDIVEDEEYRNKIQEGCELLGKWFQNLWT